MEMIIPFILQLFLLYFVVEIFHIICIHLIVKENKF